MLHTHVIMVKNVEFFEKTLQCVLSWALDGCSGKT